MWCGVIDWTCDRTTGAFSLRQGEFLQLRHARCLRRGMGCCYLYLSLLLVVVGQAPIGICCCAPRHDHGWDVVQDDSTER